MVVTVAALGAAWVGGGQHGDTGSTQGLRGMQGSSQGSPEEAPCGSASKAICDQETGKDLRTAVEAAFVLGLQQPPKQQRYRPPVPVSPFVPDDSSRPDGLSEWPTRRPAMTVPFVCSLGAPPFRVGTEQRHPLLCEELRAKRGISKVKRSSNSCIKLASHSEHRAN